MAREIAFTGMGHCVGSKVVSNSELAQSMGLEASWFEKRTGIVERRVCKDGEDVTQLSAEAVTRACRDAALDASMLGDETVLLHIQNGFTHLTPPPGILLCNELGAHRCRTLSIDGVCAEPISALEIATLLLSSSLCERVVVCAGVDFLPLIDPRDRDTVGLFGAGAGAVVLERAPRPATSRVEAIRWLNQSELWSLGVIPVLNHRRSERDMCLYLGYYHMKGELLARHALRVVPEVVEQVLGDTGWSVDDVDVVVSHQPNAKLLEIGARRLGVPRQRVCMSVSRLGNMGPASLLVGLSIAKQEGRINPGTRALLLAFGLGFSCGAATVVF